MYTQWRAGYLVFQIKRFTFNIKHIFYLKQQKLSNGDIKFAQLSNLCLASGWPFEDKFKIS